MPHPNEDTFGFSVHPTEAQICQSKENLEWKTPDALHRSLNFTPGHSTARPQPALLSLSKQIPVGLHSEPSPG